VKDVNEGITGRATTPVGTAHAEMKTSGKLETERRTSNTGITGRPTTPVSAVLRRAEDCRPTSFVSDSGARWAGKMDDLKTFEADFAAPFFEIGRRIIERVAEFDQHV